jgi:hypothetical protein
MNGRDLTLTLVGALAVGSLLGRRGSRATDPTSTPAFRRWFGASKVVDAAGRPRMVYHGTKQAGFPSFASRRPGQKPPYPIFFTADAEAAATYAHSDEEVPFVESLSEEPGPGIYRVYLRIAKPLVVNAKGREYYEIPTTGIPAAVRANVKEALRASVFDETSTDALAIAAIRLGYDGLIVKNVIDESGGDYGRFDAEPTTIYIAFDPLQIKSANLNRGTFDPNDPRISYNRSTR